jgi:hypothetical protein
VSSGVHNIFGVAQGNGYGQYQTFIEENSNFPPFNHPCSSENSSVDPRRMTLLWDNPTHT